MKINESHMTLIEQQNRVNKNKNTGAGSFQEIMDQVASQRETGKALPLNINPVQIIDSPVAITPVNGAVSGINEKDMLIDSLKDTLDLIDFYTGKLADDSFPAENLSSLIDQLDERLSTIKDMSSVGDMPEKLKPVISDIAVTIGSEIERYRRGDYI